MFGLNLEGKSDENADAGRNAAPDDAAERPACHCEENSEGQEGQEEGHVMRYALQWLLAFLDVNYCEAYWQTVHEREHFFCLLCRLMDGNNPSKVSGSD